MCHLLTYNIIDISSGLTHNIALGFEKNSNGQLAENRLQLITWGGGAKGALGLNSLDDIFIPVVNDSFANCNIKEAHCGYNHTMVLSGIFEVS
jgi:alpha-tubulin suppressor-like RCC1 family protein